MIEEDTLAADRNMTIAETFFGTSHPLFNAFGVKVEEIGKGRAVMNSRSFSRSDEKNRSRLMMFARRQLPSSIPARGIR